MLSNNEAYKQALIQVLIDGYLEHNRQMYISWAMSIDEWMAEYVLMEKGFLLLRTVQLLSPIHIEQ